MSSLYLIFVFSVLGAVAADDRVPERRALAFLAREVPRWSVDHKCYSCHNNGDAARALMVGTRQKLPVPPAALADTLRWLVQPDRWDKNGGEEFSDKGLARIQFASALVEALDAGLVKERAPLVRAAELVAEYQQKDGSWKQEAGGIVGSPATYGNCLATHFARHTLVRADSARFREPVARADRWLRDVKVETVLDAAAVLLALAGSDDADARRQRQHCLELVRKGEGKNGGWGPYVTSPPEPFDTAVVLLALLQFKDQDQIKPLLARGRAYLIAEQFPDGSWPETTRPARGESYAQRLSTAGWATMALLAMAPLSR
jgi:hypothetical protein